MMDLYAIVMGASEATCIAVSIYAGRNSRDIEMGCPSWASRTFARPHRRAAQ